MATAIRHGLQQVDTRPNKGALMAWGSSAWALCAWYYSQPAGHTPSMSTRHTCPRACGFLLHLQSAVCHPVLHISRLYDMHAHMPQAFLDARGGDWDDCHTFEQLVCARILCWGMLSFLRLHGTAAWASVTAHPSAPCIGCGSHMRRAIRHAIHSVESRPCASQTHLPARPPASASSCSYL